MNSDALLAAIHLGAWDSVTGSVQIPTQDGSGILNFRITSIVPEPGTTGLLGLGLLALAAGRRR